VRADSIKRDDPTAVLLLAIHPPQGNAVVYVPLEPDLVFAASFPVLDIGFEDLDEVALGIVARASRCKS